MRIGANQDQSITNYMIVSVDTKAPQFDIPGQPEKVACTPANDFNPNAMDGSWCQGSIEHTFALRIQNWGTDSTKEINVKDSIPAGMEYVPGSTEYATSFKTENNKKIATRWIPVPDNNGFPLENGFKVSDSLNFCPEGSNYLDCNDLIMVRFRAKVKNDTLKNQIIENIATYKSAGANDYRTNLGIPVKLRIKSAGCVTAQDAVDLSECGGVAASACTSNEECGEGNVCNKETGACEVDPSIVQCKDAQIKVNLGKNSPNGGILISNPRENLVIAQIEIEGSGEKCYLNLDQIKLKLNVNDNKITLSNLKMYKEKVDHANGTVDNGDVLIASGDIVSGYATFSASKPENIIWNNKKNNVLVVLDASYKEGEKIENNSYFQPVIEDGGVLVSGNGKPQIDGLPLELAKFQFEPETGLIITKGAKDPEVPAKSQMNSYRDVMQLRVIAKGSDDTIKKLVVSTASKSVGLGKGINKIAVYEDTDNDGKGDKELKTISSFSDQRKANLEINFDIPQNTEKYFTIKAEPALSEGEIFQIEVSASAKQLDVYGTPVSSKIYEYSCNPDVEDCGEDGGCSLTTIGF